jgi:hypothetical protein
MAKTLAVELCSTVSWRYPPPGFSHFPRSAAGVPANRLSLPLPIFLPFSAYPPPKVAGFRRLPPVRLWN